MYHAYGARMRSACLSRQVGAALMDKKGNVLSTGTNEVPRAGGGVYGGFFQEFTDRDPEYDDDHRCAVHGGYCRNTREQNEIISELMTTFRMSVFRSRKAFRISYATVGSANSSNLAERYTRKWTRCYQQVDRASQQSDPAFSLRRTRVTTAPGISCLPVSMRCSSSSLTSKAKPFRSTATQLRRDGQDGYRQANSRSGERMRIAARRSKCCLGRLQALHRDCTGVRSTRIAN